MEKFVITIGREYGSGGRGIAHRLADALGIRYYDKELIRMASEDSGISEALFNLTDEKLEDKFLRKHGIAKGTLVSQPQPDRLTKEELFQFQSEIIRPPCGYGRILHHYRRCGRIFCAIAPIWCGSLSTRTRIIASKSCGIVTASAGKRRRSSAKRQTRARAAYHKHYTGTEWLDVRNYDLALDTSKLSQDECIRIVSEYIKSR